MTLLFELQLSAAATENVVFEVRSKFSGKIEKDLRALKAHDAHRHSRLLSSAIDLPLGGDSWPTGYHSSLLKALLLRNFAFFLYNMWKKMCEIKFGNLN